MSKKRIYVSKKVGTEETFVLCDEDLTCSAKQLNRAHSRIANMNFSNEFMYHDKEGNRYDAEGFEILWEKFILFKLHRKVLQKTEDPRSTLDKWRPDPASKTLQEDEIRIRDW